MEVRRLRTMARKSVFDFGKYKSYTVQHVLDLNGHKALRYYYYYCSNISFMPDILDEIGITEKYRIAKPGTDEKMDQLLQAEKDKRMKRMIGRLGENNPSAAKEIYKKLAIRKNKKKSEALKNYQQFVSDDRKAFSKGALQRVNHGHDKSPY